MIYFNPMKPLLLFLVLPFVLGTTVNIDFTGVSVK